MAPRTGLEPVTYRLRTTLTFINIIHSIICSLDFLFTISYDLGRWCKVSTHSLRLARCCLQLFTGQGFTELATFYIYMFPYRAANSLAF